jgi:hypothetical protein
MNNNDENEWGWFITLDIDTKHDTKSNTSNTSNYYKNLLQLNIRNNKLQTIDENNELNVIKKINMPTIPYTKNIIYYKNININHIGNGTIINTSISENNKYNKYNKNNKNNADNINNTDTDNTNNADNKNNNIINKLYSNKISSIKILNYNTYRRIAIYWLYYSYIYVEYIYKYINPLLCFKSESKSFDKINNI